MHARELWKLQGKVKKFWKIKLSGKQLIEQSGRVGTAGEKRTTDFPTRAAAEAAGQALIQKRQTQGWFDKPDASDTGTQIGLAVNVGNLADVKKCLHKDPQSVHQRWVNSEQPLHVAVRRGHVGVARLLLEAGADVNSRGEDGKVPALYVMYDGDTPDFKMLALLLEFQPDLTIADDSGMTPLYLATSRKELAEFLEHHQTALDPNPTPRLIRVLEDKGMKHVLQEVEANPALARAPRIGELARAALGYSLAHCIRLMELLLKNGLDANEAWHGVPLLQDAVFRDSPEIVRMLLEHGADPNARAKDGETLLITAWRYGLKNRKAVCDVLIRRGATKDLAAVLYLDGVASLIAKIEADPQLVAAVADPVRLLSHAIGPKGSRDLVELLLRHGLDPNAHGRTKEAPLRCAVRHGNFQAVKLLLEHGANPNPEDVYTVEQQKTLCYDVESRVLNHKGGAKLQELLLAHGMTPMPNRARA